MPKTGQPGTGWMQIRIYLHQITPQIYFIYSLGDPLFSVLIGRDSQFTHKRLWSLLGDQQEALFGGPSFRLNFWYDKRHRGEIQMTSPDNKKFRARVNAKPGSTAYHPQLYAQLQRLLQAADRWPVAV